MRLFKYIVNLFIVILAFYGAFSMYRDYTMFQKNFGGNRVLFDNPSPGRSKDSLKSISDITGDFSFSPVINHAMTGEFLFLYIKEKNISDNNTSVKLTHDKIEIVFKYEISKNGTDRRVKNESAEYEKSIVRSLPASIFPDSAEIDIVPGKITVKAEIRSFD